ncbi:MULTISPECIES: 5-bromo-4-chloroindolyl phosphate hydrolysis family protein [Rahnella]|uniref:5-bromo-4-chloroindolyl phosphate hydrolysis family protein n=1 Tax=Rahnella laticis TaxID=2787622 RepID=A0ABS0E6E0_9GAMM|nr:MULTISPECIES: 5-bromo-4-chloroindolyl phosphate hydrolysis family protein [Rahnella]MBF7980611.1 5-bromo-4-chloroindolyl phosphate hydrolysis family protein [Rahnella laticis]MBF8000702.1 5-bromo-4-chloroindolyl phosphate hydrolysis family protein [Rahnella sp. LAC-M12]
MRPINHNTDAISSVYQQSRGARIFIHFLLIIAGIIYGKATSGEYLNVADSIARKDLSGASSVLVWMSFILLFHTFLYDRLSLYYSCLVGLLWAFTGDMLAIPFWMATTAMLLSLLTQFRLSLTGMFLPWIIGLFAYVDFFSFAPYTVFYAAFVIVVIGAVIHLRKIEKQSHIPVTAPMDIVKPMPLRTRASVKTESLQANTSHQIWMDDKPVRKSKPYIPARAFDQEIAQLENKSALTDFPPELRHEIAEIALSARRIQTCMQEDPKDVAPATRFFQRYMPAVNTFIDKDLNLRRQQASDVKTGERTLQTLKDIRSMFDQQHQRLLENDQLELDTEMGVLDNLMKTDGFK